jgi:ribose-phosphate pyrophosphokinase
MDTRQHIHWKATAEYPYVLSLDENFKPYGNPQVPLEFKKFNFHGGEPHFQITSNVHNTYERELIITQRYSSVSDLFDIILANDAARRMGFKNISLILPYFPAARQDRVCNAGEPLTIKVFTDMINSCAFDSVTILCPHSEVTPALINNVLVLDELKYTESIISDIINNDNVNINKNPVVNVVCPDAGAGKRVGKIVTHLSNRFTFITFNLIRCEKVRDVKDGSLKDFFVQADDLGGHYTIIFDDINSMGGTFIGLGKKLREKNCGKLMLFTAHSDCAEGIRRVTNEFDFVYTTNSKPGYENILYHNFKCLKIEL